MYSFVVIYSIAQSTLSIPGKVVVHVLAHLSSVTAHAVVVATPPESFAALLGAAFLTALLSGLGGILAYRNKWDNWLRVAVALFAISPLLLTIPLFGAVGQVINSLVTAIVNALGGTDSAGEAWSFFITLAIAIIGVIIYKDKPGIGRLLIMTLAVSGILGTKYFQPISDWFIHNVGLQIWNLAVKAWILIQSIPVNVG